MVTDIDDDKLIAHVWKNTDDMTTLTKLGYYTVLSACWYLDHISTTADWRSYYSCDPQVQLQLFVFNQRKLKKTLNNLHFKVN